MAFNTGYVTAQIAHVAVGAVIPLWFANRHHAGLGFVLAAAIAVGKESLESLGWAFWEGRQPWLNGLVDMAFFAVGIGLAALSYL